MADPFGLARFVDAQNGVFEQALAELRAGAKRSHWMWFIFPQLAGLGHSAMAIHYGIGSPAEARAYLAHSLLGPRLRLCTQAVLAHDGTPLDIMLGSVDALKFRSSMTLFETASGEAPFARALDAFCGGERDPATLAILS